MILDHTAYRVKSRWEFAKFYLEYLHYEVAEEFEINFKSKFYELEEGEYFWWQNERYQKLELYVDSQTAYNAVSLYDKTKIAFDDRVTVNQGKALCIALKSKHQSNPEIFISEGSYNSLVQEWVDKHGDSIHHQAYVLPTLEDLSRVVQNWKSKGIEFTSDIIKCDQEDNSLYQIFSKPLSGLGGIVIELLVRPENSPGFCGTNIQKLMLSSKE